MKRRLTLQRRQQRGCWKLGPAQEQAWLCWQWKEEKVAEKVGEKAGEQEGLPLQGRAALLLLAREALLIHATFRQRQWGR